MARDNPLNIFDLDPLLVSRPDEITHLALGEFHCDWLAGELATGEQAIECALEIATIVGCRFGDVGEHRGRNVEARMMMACGCNAGFENFQTQFLPERAHFHNQATREP